MAMGVPGIVAMAVALAVPMPVPVAVAVTVTVTVTVTAVFMVVRRHRRTLGGGEGGRKAGKNSTMACG